MAPNFENDPSAPPSQDDFDQTVRLKAGEPVPPKPTPTKSPTSTQPIPTEVIQAVISTPPPVALDADHAATQAMNRVPEAPAAPPQDPVADSKTIQIQLMQPDEQPAAEPVPAPHAEPRAVSGTNKNLVMGGVLVVAIIVVLVFFISTRRGASEAPSSAQESSQQAASPAAKVEVTEAIQPYLERAKNGDTVAMHMLGHCYYNGLNVAQNRPEGLRWYRMAAAAGSTSAQKELDALEGKEH